MPPSQMVVKRPVNAKPFAHPSQMSATDAAAREQYYLNPPWSAC